MRRFGLIAVFVFGGLGCGASRQASETAQLLLSSPSAELAQALAPDLYTNAKLAFAAADEAARDDHEQAAEDLRTEGRLWLAAAITEAERLQLDQKRLELQDDEEKWGKRLARDRSATDEVAQDIARQEASALALEEAERLSMARVEKGGSPELFDALMFRLRTELAVAAAFGAPAEELSALQRERAALEGSANKPARAAEALLAETSALVGRMRATAPQPAPGASTELLDAALVAGFEADQDAAGTVLRSDRIVSASGTLSTQHLERMRALLDAFPHGPVLCQLAAPAPSARWEKAVAKLSNALSQSRDGVSVDASPLGGTATGTLQCRFPAYVRY